MKKQLKISSLLNFFFTTYIFSFAIEKLFSMKTSVGVIFLPEILYIPLFFLFCAQLPQIWQKRREMRSEFLLFDALILAYGFCVCTSYLFHPTTNSLRETIGCGYMMSFYFILNTTFRAQNRDVWLKKGIKIFIWSGIIGAIAAIISYVLGTIGTVKDLSRTDDYYPITGGSLRAFGLFRNPIFLANHLICTLIVFVSYYFDEIKQFKSRFWGILFLFFIALFLTKTKSVLLALAIGLYFVTTLWNINKSFRYALFSISILSIIAYIFLSHFLIVDMYQPHLTEKLKMGYYFPEFILPITDRYALVPTFYYGTKRAAILAFYDFFPFGVGGDNLSIYVHKLVAQGRHMQAFCCAPHSTFFGALGELGVLGFGLLVALLSKFWQFASTLRVPNSPMRSFNLMAKSLAFFLIIEGITVDLMNVRHFWLVLAVLALLYRTNRLQNVQKGTQ
jgi:hypothetical protein